MGARACWLCGSAKIEFERLDARFSRARCKACGVLSVEPHLTREEARELYEHELRWSSSVGSYTSAGRTRIFERIRERLDLMLDRNGSARELLDVGCGDGGFMRFMRSSGYGVTGCEINEELATRDREAGLDVRSCAVEELDGFGRGYDAIAMLNTFGYVSDPVAALATVGRRLNSGGIVVIEDPNTAFHVAARQLLAPIGRADRVMTVAPHPPRRLFAFSERSYRLLFDAAGLSTVLIEAAPARREGDALTRNMRGALSRVATTLRGMGAPLLAPTLIAFGRKGD